MDNLLWSKYELGKLKFAAVLLIAAVPTCIIWILLSDVVGMGEPAVWYFSGAVFYSIAVFLYASLERGSMLFRDEDTRTMSKLLRVHLGYLCGLFVLLAMAPHIQPHLPEFLLRHDERNSSWAVFLLIIAICAVFFFEENWLAAKKK